MNSVCEVATKLHDKQCNLQWCLWEKEENDNNLLNKDDWMNLGNPHHKYYYVKANKIVNFSPDSDLVGIIDLIYADAYGK